MEHSRRQFMENLRNSYRRGRAASGSQWGGWKNLMFDLTADVFRKSHPIRCDFDTLTEDDLCPHERVTEIRRVPRKIVRCRRCGVAFAVERDDVNRAIERHQGDYFMANKGFLYEDGEPDVFSYLMPRILFFWALGYPRYRPDRRRALDVGAGQGIMVRYLEFLGWEAWGVEISKWAVNFAREKLDCRHMVQGTLQDARFDSGSFDLVTLVHVLEHLDEPVPLLKEIFRILADGAYLYVEVPSSERDVSDYGIDDHFWFYSPDSLRYLLSCVGFREVNVSEGTFDPRLHNVPFIFAAARKPPFSHTAGLISSNLSAVD